MLRPIFLLAFAFTLTTVAPTRSRAAEILYVGDSHSSGYFGQEFEKSLRATTDPATHRVLTVRSVATCGSSIAGWLQSSGTTTACGYRACGIDGKCVSKKKGQAESLPALAKKEKPRVTVVALGTNMLKQNSENVMREVTSAIEQIKANGSECIWIGPPQAARFVLPIAKYEKFNESLKNTVQSNGCLYIASNDKTARENLKDSMGLHYGPKDGQAWAKKVAAEATLILAMLLTSPAKKTIQKPTQR